MLRPENTDPQYNDIVIRDSDNMETTLPVEAPNHTDSASSQDDAGLMAAPDIDRLDPGADDSLEEPMEITMTDALAGEQGESTIASAVMDDMSSPGELDIEGLDEDALSDTDIPREALLDPLEP